MVWGSVGGIYFQDGNVLGLKVLLDEYFLQKAFLFFSFPSPEDLVQLCALISLKTHTAQGSKQNKQRSQVQSKLSYPFLIPSSILDAFHPNFQAVSVDFVQHFPQKEKMQLTFSLS